MFKFLLSWLSTFSVVNSLHSRSQNIKSNQVLVRTQSNTLFAKFSMPTFDEDDEEALMRMGSGNDDYDSELPDFSENVRPKPRRKDITKNGIAPSTPSIKKPDKQLVVPSTNPRKNLGIPSPNMNWRSALTESSPDIVSRSVADNRQIRSPVYTDQNDPYFVDLDYDDFERAMFEIEMGGINPATSSKQSAIPTEHAGLKSGEVFSQTSWSRLVDSTGEVLKDINKITKSNDVLILYADPRRFNSEYKIVLEEFKKLPSINLKVSPIAINCDDPNDLRKFLKKNPLPFPVLSDPSRAFMDAVKCRAKKRLVSSLMMVEASTNRVLKIWYENDWDVLTTKDLLAEEIQEYRKDPRAFVQSQIGIR